MVKTRELEDDVILENTRRLLHFVQLNESIRLNLFPATLVELKRSIKGFPKIELERERNGHQNT